MDPTPLKRRKVSHPNSPLLSAPSTPTSQGLQRDGTRTSARRASFASPTRASIARFNPVLITRPRSAGFGDQRIKDRRAGSLTPRRRLQSPPKSSIIGDSQPTRSSVAPSEVVSIRNLQERTPAPSLEPANTGKQVGTTLAERLLQTPPRRRKQLLNRSSSVVGSSTEVRSFQKKPISARGSRAKDDVPIVRRSTRQSAARSSTRFVSDAKHAQRIATDDEPDLPATPSASRSQHDSVGKPPSGLFSSPSGRFRRTKGSQRDSGSAAPRALTSMRADGSDVRLPVADAISPRMDIDDEVSLRTNNENDVSSAPKAQDEGRDQLEEEARELQKEIQQLEHQVRIARKQGVVLENYDNIEFRPLASGETSLRQPSPELSLFSINAFLPFSKRRPITSVTTSLSLLPDHPVPSHRPIDLENPMPYLQAFTPLKFSSDIQPLRTQANNKTAAGRREVHTISASSPGQLLSGIISLTVITTSHCIAEVAISALSPWAERELGRWIRARALSPTPAGRDVTSICYAMGRYWLLARQRARSWIRCERTYTELIPSSHHPVSKRQQPTSRVSADDGDPLIDDSHSDGDEDQDPSSLFRSKQSSTRHDLSRYLGRSSLIFRQQGVQLRIAWDISFDWTGETQSHVSASATVPGIWSRVDSRASLTKIPILFETLVRDHGVFDATRLVVALLYS